MKKHIYLNSASIAQPYPESIKASQDFLAQWQTPTFRYGLHMIDQATKLKAKLGKFLNAPAQNFAIVPNTAIGLSTILNAYPFQPGDELMVLANEFPSNAFPYMAQTQKGTLTIPISEAEFYQNPIETIEKTRTPNSKLLALSLVGYTSGYKLDLKEISNYCQTHKLLLFIDATQGAGVVPIDLEDTPVDVLIASGYKWLRWPPVIAFAYISPTLLPKLSPQIAGWLSVKNRPNITYPLDLEFPETAQKFEPGGMNMIGLYAANAAMDQVLNTGIKTIESELKIRTKQLLKNLNHRTLETLIPYTTQNHAGIISFKIEQSPDEFAAYLEQENIWITYRNGAFRLSPHYDTPLEDIATFFHHLDQFKPTKIVSNRT